MAKHFFLFPLFLLSLAHALTNTKSAFTSIDCGYMGQDYIDNTTRIRYSADNQIDTGEVHNISPDYKAKSPERQFENLRSFPQGNRNCYTLSAHGNSTQFLIRARFMYGNYDGKNHPPKFDIYVGATWWDSVEFDNAWSVVTKEIIYENGASSDKIHVCLCNTNNGTPFISVLERRPLEIYPFGSYPTDFHLVHLARFNLGSQDNKPIRFPEDDYDRIWTPYNSKEWKQINTSHIDPADDKHRLDKSYPPSIIMRTAVTPANENHNLSFYFKPRSNASSCLAILYYQDIRKPEADQPIDYFSIYMNGDLQIEEAMPRYRMTDENGTDPLKIWIHRRNQSGPPPLLNAIELFSTRNPLQNRTYEKEYDAIMNIRRLYKINRNWQGDPCAPLNYVWDGIKCHQDSDQYRIVSLDLSSSGIKQVIATDIGDLSSIEYLDLSNNSLTGTVPDFLSQLQSLRVLKLERNQLSGTIPLELLRKSKNKSLNFSFGENPNLCYPGPCKKRLSKKVIKTLIATLGGALILLAAVTFWIFKTKQSAAKGINKKCFLSKPSKVLDSNKQEFAYQEIQAITNNFGNVLGKGGFGTVYHGHLGNTEVAVKMLSPSAVGYQQFQAEAELLTKVHHKCLTSLIGYCDEGTNVALIYEYMSNGDLSEHLSGKSGKFLRWKERLQIAVDAAEGLEYLHNGCKPPIIHRDIKPQNILLNENLHGKLGDFGLSRIFSDEDDTHVSTAIAGTRGYFDPEYFMSNRLNEKSDVFSFGIVLLEIITGQPAIAKTEDRTHIIEWLNSMLREREVDDVVDSRLHGEFCTSSVRKALDTAMACVKSSSINRPTMTQVVTELKECLAMEMSRASHHIDIPNSINDSSIDIIIEDEESFLAR